MALAISAFSKGCDVTLWSPFKEEVNLLNEKRTNKRLLKDIYLPDGIKITDEEFMEIYKRKKCSV